MKTPMTKLMLAAAAATLLCLGARADTANTVKVTKFHQSYPYSGTAMVEYTVGGTLPANPPLIDIAFEDGKVVIKTPPVVNSDGVTVSVVESGDVAGKTVTATKALGATGRAEFTPPGSATSRFNRLKAELTE